MLLVRPGKTGLFCPYVNSYLKVDMQCKPFYDPPMSRNANHPPKGATIKVEPIRSLEAIQGIKARLEGQGRARDLCLFTVGINTAYRAGELLSLTVGQVEHLGVGDRLEVFQPKTRRYRATTLNRPCVTTIASWLAVHPEPHPEAALFYSRRSRRSLGVSVLNRLVKSWCADEGLAGNYGSHTLRKTWGYHQLRQANTPLPFLMTAYGHATQQQTLEYLCIEAEEISALYTALEL